MQKKLLLLFTSLSWVCR